MTDNLPVETGAGLSALTSKDDEERFARLSSPLLAFVVAVNPTDLSTDFYRRDRLPHCRRGYADKERSQYRQANNIRRVHVHPSALDAWAKDGGRVPLMLQPRVVKTDIKTHIL